MQHHILQLNLQQMLLFLIRCILLSEHTFLLILQQNQVLDIVVIKNLPLLPLELMHEFLQENRCQIKVLHLHLLQFRLLQVVPPLTLQLFLSMLLILQQYLAHDMRLIQKYLHLQLLLQ